MAVDQLGMCLLRLSKAGTGGLKMENKWTASIVAPPQDNDTQTPADEALRISEAQYGACRKQSSSDVNMRLVKNERGATIYREGTIEDITERTEAESHRKELEQQLRQSQKMEAIGQLAGGVAQTANFEINQDFAERVPSNE